MPGTVQLPAVSSVSRESVPAGYASVMKNSAGLSGRDLRALVLWALIAYLGYRLVVSLQATLLIFGVAIFLALILDPPIRYLDRHGLSRGMSVLIIVLLLLGALTAAVAFSIRPLVQQVEEMAASAPSYAAAIEKRIQTYTGRYPYLEQNLQNGDVGRWLSEVGRRLAGQVGRFSVGVLGSLFTGILVLVTALYAVLDPKPLLRGVVMAAPQEYRRVVLRSIVGIGKQVQAWAIATLGLMIIVGVLSGVGLWAIGVKGALLFGVLAGIGEAIPTIGPILTAIPPALVGLAESPSTALWVVALFVVIQQLENHLLVPRVMAAALRLHPVSVLFFVVSLGMLLGPVGILLATPVCAAVKVVYREVAADRRRRERAAEGVSDTDSQ